MEGVRTMAIVKKNTVLRKASTENQNKEKETMKENTAVKQENTKKDKGFVLRKPVNIYFDNPPILTEEGTLYLFWKRSKSTVINDCQKIIVLSLGNESHLFTDTERVILEKGFDEFIEIAYDDLTGNVSALSKLDQINEMIAENEGKISAEILALMNSTVQENKINSISAKDWIKEILLNMDQLTSNILNTLKSISVYNR